MRASARRAVSEPSKGEVSDAMRVAVVGLGYVGTVTAACLAANGHDVSGVDIDAGKVEEIRAGHSPVAEPGLDAIVASAVADGMLRATTSCAEAVRGADVTLVCVGTPATARGATELAFIRRAVDDIAAALKAGSQPDSGQPGTQHHSVVIRSTVPPGTVEDVVMPALTSGLDGANIAVGAAMCPEFLREGSGVADFFAPPMIVVGTSDSAVAETCVSLFGFLDTPVQVVEVRVAEALKYACNAFHATKVSFTNELSRLFRLLNVDSREVMSLFCQDRVLNISPSYLRPGFAFGGSCLPKDLRSLLHLARINGADMPLLAGTLATNELVVQEVVDRVVAIDARAVALLGLSFKADTDDLRESPNVELAERLLGKGFDVHIFDQVVNPARLVGANRRYMESRLPHLERLLVHEPGEALCGADVAIVSIRDQAVIDALVRHRPGRVIDLIGNLGTEAESLPGYEGLGW
jgi:GDP-mannose 6-dehydrogenase